MRKRAAAIIRKDNTILVMHRLKNKQDYYIIPGGGVEKNETFEEACIREVFEETSFIVDTMEYAFSYDNKGNPEKYYQITKYHGDIGLGGPELIKQTDTNQFLLEWIPIEQLRHIRLFPHLIAKRIINLLKS